MAVEEEIANCVQKIEDDIDLLRNKRIKELDNVPGRVKCSTLADRIKNNLDHVVNAYEEIIQEKAISADRDQFELLSGLLSHLYIEIAGLSKKRPDGLVNSFKVDQINKVLRPLKEIMKDEPSAEFLNLVVDQDNDQEMKTDNCRNTYSDTALILCQFKEACEKYRQKITKQSHDDFLSL